MVVDTDPGTDDAQAIGMMLSADGRGEIRLLGLTITFGNSTVKQCTRNARRILSVFNRLDVSFYNVFAVRSAGRQYLYSTLYTLYIIYIHYIRVYYIHTLYMGVDRLHGFGNRGMGHRSPTFEKFNFSRIDVAIKEIS